MGTRTAHVHPSGMSPAEHEAYTLWVGELDGQISKLGRGLRFGEMVGFIRKRTPVERENEIMPYFGSMTQQQSMGVGEFLAILRLLAHARTCATLCRDHIFIQTHPLVLTSPLSPDSSNPFFRAQDIAPSVMRKATSAASLAAKKKKAPLPPLATAQVRQQQALPPPQHPLSAGGHIPEQTTASPSVTPPSSTFLNNPFLRQQVATHADRSAASTIRMPPTPPESTTLTVKSPPLPPRPPSSAKPASSSAEPPPKHVTQQYQSLDDPSLTPTQGRSNYVPTSQSITSIDIISSSTSTMQPQHTGQSTSSLSLPRLPKQGTGSSNRRSANFQDGMNVRLLGSSHIGVDAKPLRKNPSSATVKNSSSSEEFMLHKNGSDSSLSLSSLSAHQASGNGKRAENASIRTKSTVASGKVESQEEEILSEHFKAPPPPSHSRNSETPVKTAAKESSSGRIRPPAPPPPRRRPDSLRVDRDPYTGSQKLVFGAEPAVVHTAPFTATTIQSSSLSRPHKSRSPQSASTRVFPGAVSQHTRSASASQITYGPPSGANLRYSASMRNSERSRASDRDGKGSRPIDAFLSKGKDVSQDWLEKARAGMTLATQPGNAAAAAVLASTSPRPVTNEEGERLIGQEASAYESRNRGMNGANNAFNSPAKNYRDDEGEDDDGIQSGSDSSLTQQKSVQERKRELERLRSDNEVGWTRLD